MKIPALIVGCVLAGLFTLLGVTAPGPLVAQVAESTPILLVLPESFPPVDARVVLMREPGRDFVVLNPADASADALGAALMLLRRLRREAPAPRRGQMIPVTGFVFRRDLSDDQRERLEASLVRLRGRPSANVGNVGRGRWMTYDAP